MGKFETFTLLKWIHFVAFSVIGGGGVVALLLSGFEEEREDLRGLAATIWKRTVGWAARIAVLLGIGLLVLKIQGGQHPFDHYYLHTKLLLVVILLAASEMAPKHLAAGKRGAAMVALLMFLATTFVTFNKTVFGSKVRVVPEHGVMIVTPGS
ncbi:MAG: hypothetical protein IPL96_08300 [Holophagaceae bacterium]|nr:hypothetical protein [Holophagaceae bacterium]